MKRRLFTILSAVSLLVFVAVVVMFVRSFSVRDVVRFKMGDGIDGMISRDGTIIFFEDDESGSKPRRPPSAVATLPYLAPAFVSAVLPSLWLTIRMTRPFGYGLCGYDLRATPGRCPECGTVPTEANVSNAVE